MACKIITIAQQKGGAGKTTIAAQLVVAFSKKGKKVTLIDIDPQGTLTNWVKLRKEKLGTANIGFDFAAFAGWKLPNELSKLANHNDIILIDSPPHTENDTKTAVRASDMVIVPMQPSPGDLWATQTTLELVNKERVPYRIVLNRVTDNSILTGKIVPYFQAKDLLDIQIHDREIYPLSMFEGDSVFEMVNGVEASAEINALTERICDLVAPEYNQEFKVASG